MWRRVGSNEKVLMSAGQRRPEEGVHKDMAIIADIDDDFSKSLLLECCSNTDVLSSFDRLPMVRKYNIN